MLDLSEVKGGSLSFFLQMLDLSEVRRSFYTGFVPDTINRKDYLGEKKRRRLKTYVKLMRSEITNPKSECRLRQIFHCINASGLSYGSEENLP
jgi:hypothetical protein